MAFEIMYDNVMIAYKNVFTYHLVSGIPGRSILPGLFKYSDVESTNKVIDYFCDRVFPKERVDCEEVLKTLGLKFMASGK